MNESPRSQPENGLAGTPLPPTNVADGIRRLLESPDAERVRDFMRKCAAPNVSPAELDVLENESVAVEFGIDDGPDADALRDAVRLAKTFIYSRRGSLRATEAQGEWRAALGRLEASADWRGSLAAWNTGKIESLMAGSLPPEQQLPQLRRSLDGFLRSARRGVQQLPMEMPVSGANIDLSYLQTDAQRGTPMTNVIAPPHRLIAALATTVAYPEKEAGNAAEVERLLGIVDEQHAAAKESYANAPFLRLNLAINRHITDGAIRGAVDVDGLQKFLDEVDVEPTLDDFKKNEWSAHGYALLALATGKGEYVDNCFTLLEEIRAARPAFMAVIAIEPTFKELAKRFPQAKARLDELITTKD